MVDVLLASKYTPELHWVKSNQIRRFFWSVFFLFGLNTEIEKKTSIFSQNTGRYGPEKTLYLDTLHSALAIV